MMRTPTPRLLVLIVAIAAVLAASMASVASADGSTERNEPPERIVLRLEPGGNSIGWVGALLPVHDMFESVPEIETIYAWDGVRGRWLMAAPAVPTTFWSLHELQPGAELFVRVGGDKPVQFVWEQDLHLGPDVHYVGWLGGAMPIDDLLETYQQIGSAYAWDSALQQWRKAPKELRYLYPGMGLRIQLASDQSLGWEHATPVTGLVELRAGDNLVAWSGKDRTPIIKVVRGIGAALLQARRWNTADQQFEIFDPTIPESAETFSPIDRGDALWITVSRQVNWLQPTGEMPEIEFPGGVSSSIESRVSGDLQTALDFYEESFGMQPDFSNYTLLVSKSVSDLIKHYETLGALGDGCDRYCAARLRAQWDRSDGWAGSSIVLKQELFDCSNCGLGTLTHELFHIIQRQLSVGYRGPTWLIEGTAEWGAAVLGEALDNQRSRYQEQIRNMHDYVAEGPTLKSTEAWNYTWQYALGLAATDMLVERAGADSPFEYYRALRPSNGGPTGRWRFQHNWHDAFATTFGISVDEFYAEFDAWQESLPNRRRITGDADEQSLSGRLVRKDGTPIEDVWVTASQIENDVPAGWVGWPRRTVTDSTGLFELFVPRNSNNSLSIDLVDGSRCTVYYAGDDVWPVYYMKYQELIRVDFNAPPPLRIVVPQKMCTLEITGRVLGPNGIGLAGVELTTYPEIPESPRTTSGANGSFALVVPDRGRYWLSVGFGNCYLSWDQFGGFDEYSSRPITADTERATHKLNSSVDVGDIQLPGDVCLWQISGRVLAANGDPMSDVRVTADYGHYRGRALTDTKGYFNVLIPRAGQYSISLSISVGCIAYISDEATLVSVSNDDIVGINMRLNRDLARKLKLTGIGCDVRP